MESAWPRPLLRPTIWGGVGSAATNGACTGVRRHRADAVRSATAGPASGARPACALTTHHLPRSAPHGSAKPSASPVPPRPLPGSLSLPVSQMTPFRMSVTTARRPGAYATSSPTSGLCPELAARPRSCPGRSSTPRAALRQKPRHGRRVRDPEERLKAAALHVGGESAEDPDTVTVGVVDHALAEQGVRPVAQTERPPLQRRLHRMVLPERPEVRRSATGVAPDRKAAAAPENRRQLRSANAVARGHG